jgi:hypothetical protein
LIRFEDSFTVAIENKELSFYQASGLTLNLVEVAGSEKFFSAALLGGRMKEGNIILTPAGYPMHGFWIIPMEAIFLTATGIRLFLSLRARDACR